MNYSHSHLSGPVLLRDAKDTAVGRRVSSALFLSQLAEIDTRALYAEAGYHSMYAYCRAELLLSEDSACRRIKAAQVARRFPAIFPMVADGGLHLSAILQLAPYLTEENAAALLSGAAHHGKDGIERLLAEHFPRPDVPALVQALAPSGSGDGLSALARITPACASAEVQEPRPKVTALAPQRFAIQATIDQGAHDDLRYAQELLRHRLPSGDVGAVLGLALKALVRQLETRKFAATEKPRPGQRRASRNPRHIPAAVKRQVRERDGGRCTFVSESGRRCDARGFLEFDHVTEVARGGEATVEGIRLRCRTHNQHTAERTFGAGFMHEKREAARRAAAERRVRAAAAAADRARVAAAEQDPERSVIPWLRRLGIRVEDARRAEAHCGDLPDTPIEERVRRALSFLGPRQARSSASGLGLGS